jgi:integration host factor subunit beta
MTKAELIETLSIELKCSNKIATSIVNTMLDAMTKALISGDNVEIRGFGSFSIRNYASYTGRNPKSHEEIQVKARKMPFFTVGKALREAVNESK